MQEDCRLLRGLAPSGSWSRRGQGACYRVQDHHLSWALSVPVREEEPGVPEVQDDAQRAPADGVAVDAVRREPDAADRVPVVAHRELVAARVVARDVHHEQRLDAAEHEDFPRDGDARGHAPKPWACTRGRVL